MRTFSAVKCSRCNKAETLNQASSRYREWARLTDETGADKIDYGNMQGLAIRTPGHKLLCPECADNPAGTS